MTTAVVSVKVEWRDRFLHGWIDRLIETALQRAGVRVRGYMLANLRPGAGSSSPGSWPHAHAAGNSGLRLIRSAVDRQLKLVAVGTLRYRNRFEGTVIQHRRGVTYIRPVGKTVPQNTAEGGTNRIITVFKSGARRRGSSRHAARDWLSLTRPVAITILQDTMRSPRAA